MSPIKGSKLNFMFKTYDIAMQNVLLVSNMVSNKVLVPCILQSLESPNPFICKKYHSLIIIKLLVTSRPDVLGGVWGCFRGDDFIRLITTFPFSHFPEWYDNT